MIVWWLLGARILIDVGLVAKYTPVENVIFLSVGALGLGSVSCITRICRFESERFFFGTYYYENHRNF